MIKCIKGVVKTYKRIETQEQCTCSKTLALRVPYMFCVQYCYKCFESITVEDK